MQIIIKFVSSTSIKLFYGDSHERKPKFTDDNLLVVMD